MAATTLSVRIDEELNVLIEELTEELSARAGGIEIERSAVVRAAVKKGYEAFMSEKKGRGR